MNKQVSWKGDEKGQNPFWTIKEVIVSSGVLAHYDLKIH